MLWTDPGRGCRSGTSVAAVTRPRTSAPWRRRLRRRLHRHRRLVAALLVAASVAVGTRAAAPPDPATVPVLVVTRDLPAGAVLGRTDLALARQPPQTRPDGFVPSADDAVGRTLAAAVRRGEPVTDVRLVGAPMLRGLAEGTVAAPVRVADVGEGALVAVGDVVDVLAAEAVLDGTAPGDARVVAPRVRVLAVPTGSESSSFSSEGALLVVAATPAQALALARAAVTSRLSIVLRPPAPGPPGSRE